MITKLDAYGAPGSVGKISFEEMRYTGVMDMTGRAEHCIKTKGCTLEPGHKGLCRAIVKHTEELHAVGSDKNDIRGIDSELDPDA